MKNTLLTGIFLLTIFFPGTSYAKGNLVDLRANSRVTGVPSDTSYIRAGIARVAITPELPMWLTGYAAREKPASGIVHDLWAKALALEESPGNRMVIVTVDLLGLSHEISEEVAKQVNAKFGIQRSQLLLNSSHTHSGPMVWPCLDVIYDFTPEDQQRVSLYSQLLIVKLVELIGKSLEKMEPAILYSGHGMADFAINRRNSIHPDGPVDHDVSVLKVSKPDGQLRAILFGYACHNTTVVAENNLVNGDYAGFAQIELENHYPGAQAMFLMGCAGDQNPEPRGTIELADRHGKSLALAVEKVLSGNMQFVHAPMRTSFTTVKLPFRSFDLEKYRKEIVSSDRFLQRRAKLMLDAYNRGWQPRELTYPVQAIRFNKDLTILALSDEVVVDYAITAKKEFPAENLFVAGYSGEVMCYIPNRRILREGGYEPDESMIYYGFPGPFKESVEDSVFLAIRRVMKEAGAAESVESYKKDKLCGTLGTYAFPPRLNNGLVNEQLLLSQLKDLHANTYHWLAWGKANDMVALKKFLPLARKANINVWVTLVPKSESPPYQKDYSEPYRLDFKKWAVELSALSLKETNLVAWSIDDFVHNLDVLTPAYVKDFLASSHSINPKLAFIPCCYFEQITPEFVSSYGGLLDGILFPYRNESVSANLQDASHVGSEIDSLRARFDPGFLIFLDIYATAHSSLGNSTPAYVREVLARGRKAADGVLIYCHQDPKKFPEKYAVIREGFSNCPNQ